MNDLYVTLQPFFHWVIQTSIVCSGLVGFIILMKLIFRNKLPARWQYLLWFTLLFRLILPPLPDGMYHFQNVLPENPLKTTVFQSIIPQQESHKLIPQTISDSTPTKNISKINNEPQHQTIPVEQILMVVWLIGFLSLIFMTIFSNLQLGFYVKRQSNVMGSNVIQLFELCKGKMSIKRKIPLLVTKKLISPTLFGFIKPKVLLSQNHIHILDESQLMFIFYHELSHLKRKDIAVNYLMNLLLIIHWFNPILWYAFYRMRQDQEVACDALALSYIDKNQKLAYGYTIIKLLDSYTYQSPITSFTGMTGGKQSIKRRILMIKQFQKKSYRWSFIGAASLILIFLFSFISANAASNVVSKKADWLNVSYVYDKTASRQSANTSSEEMIPNTADGKAQIQKLMLNSIDYYKKASGTMQYLSTTANYNLVINYQTDLSDNPKSYENDQEIPIDSTNPLESAKAKGLHTETQIYDGNSTAMITSDPKIVGGRANTNAMKVDKITKSQRDELKGSGMKNRIIKMDGENGPNTYFSRVDPSYMGIAKISLFPEDIAMGFLADTTQWNIAGNENIAGINTVIIKGILNSDYSQRYKAQNFTLNVDPKTGILLQMEVTNSSGEITQLVKTFSIEINRNLNDKLFSIPSL